MTHPVALADPTTNAARVLEVARELHDRGVAAAVFPELDLTGYSIDDLVFQDVLLDDVLAAIKTIVDGSEGLTPVLAVGAPLRKGTRLFNCAVVIKDGEVLGVVPKSHLPTYKEFYEKRWYAPGLDQRGQYIDLGDLGEVPFGPDLIFRAVDLPDLAIHVEICEDVWVPIPPSSEAALAGALGLRLGGRNVYGSRVEDRPVLGSGHPPVAGDIRRATRLSTAVWTTTAALAAGARLLRRTWRA